MSTMEMETNRNNKNRRKKERRKRRKQRLRECQENVNPDEANLLITGIEALKFISDYQFHRPLPLELNCEVFKCLPKPIQTKFIWAIGRGIYGVFRHKLLVKTKRLRNPRENLWIRTETKHSISPNGLTINCAWKYFFAKLAFCISGDCRKEYNDYPGTILYYFELAQMSKTSSNKCFYIGLTNNENARYPDSYSFSIAFDYCHIIDKKHNFEWPNGANKPTANRKDDVVGCGLVLSPQNEVSIFFTGNGILMGKQIQIHPSADCLYPIVSMCDYADMTLETNFGDDLAKPFKYDIEKCPGLGLD